MYGYCYCNGYSKSFSDCYSQRVSVDNLCRADSGSQCLRSFDVCLERRIGQCKSVGNHYLHCDRYICSGMHWHRHKTGANHYEKYKSLGRRMPVTVTLGGDPSYVYAATAPMPENMDEYLLAGFLRKKHDARKRLRNS